MDASAAARDLREFLRSGPDFDVLELSRARELARVIELDPADPVGEQPIDRFEADP